MIDRRTYLEHYWNPYMLSERGHEPIELAPFAETTKEKAPEWWSAHNKAKHDRMQEPPQGNPENALNALAALYYVNLILAKRVGGYWHERLPHEDENTRDVPNDLSRLFIA